MRIDLSNLYYKSEKELLMEIWAMLKKLTTQSEIMGSERKP
jgi:hypothetical protein